LVRGPGNPRLPALGYIGAGVMNLFLSIAFVKPLGLFGVALGTAIPNVLFAIYIFHVACKELDLQVGQSLWYIVPRSAAGAIPVLALLLWCRYGLNVRSFAGIAAAGAAAVITFGIVWVSFVYRDDPYVNVKSYWVRMRAWRSA